MSCDKELQRLNGAVAVLETLWDELAVAAPSKKPAIAAKIDAQNVIVDQARANYETCVQKDHVPGTSTSATFSLISLRSNDTRVFFNEPDVARIFRFTGPASERGFNVDPIVVTRTATFNISGIHGSLVPATGAMKLDATVDISMFGQTATLNISTSTGPSASPTGLFTMIGKALDPADNSFRLVGTGRLDYPPAAIYGLEYGIAFDGSFAIAP
jgi:hypothetical protein